MDKDNPFETNVVPMIRTTGQREADRIKKHLDEGDRDLNTEVELMNLNHQFICSIGGKNYVKGEKYDEVTNSMVLEFVTADSHKLRYCNRRVGFGKGIQPLGKAWMEHPARKTYATVVFDPSRNEKEFTPTMSSLPVLNLWEGLKVVPVKGSWSKLRRHVYRILCNGDKVKFKYMMRWLAWTVQNVDTRAEVALIVKGKQGAGKGILFSQFKEIFGVHYMNIASSDHLTGKFNEHLRRCVFLFADEAYDPKDRESEGKLKQLITEETIPIEAKFRDTVIARNRLHIVMATNNDRVIIAGDDTRRFFINECNNTWAKGQGKTDKEIREYFTPIWEQMNNGGRAAMLYDLLNTKLGKWHPRHDIPETAEMNHQRRLQFSAENAVAEYLENGVLPDCKDDGLGNYIVKAKQLEKHMRETIPSLKDPKIINWKKVRAILAKLGISEEERTIRRLGDGIAITFPHLHVIRAKWDIAYSAFKGDWKQQDKPDSNDRKDLMLYEASRNWEFDKNQF